MNAIIEKRSVRKSVSIEIEIDPLDYLRALTVDELKAECRRRMIGLKGDGRKNGPRRKIDIGELDDVRRAWTARDFDDALHKLEWDLPQSFRGFADAIAKHYRDQK